MSETWATDPNEARINRVLAAAHHREASALMYGRLPMTIGELVDGRAPSDDDDVPQIRNETVVRMLHFVFQDGPHPGSVTRLIYLLAQRLTPDLVLRMSGSEMADMLGETRAAWSARNQRIFTGYLRARGTKGAKGRSDKSEAARVKYAAAQLGNTNRRGKLKSSGMAAAKDTIR
jgi:hypothetical protein